jgi:hypothetical protein
MARLNLTLGADTYRRLERHARTHRTGRATLARTLLEEGLERRERAERERRLARDYAAGRADARRLLAELEAGQLELMRDER